MGSKSYGLNPLADFEMAGPELVNIIRKIWVYEFPKINHDEFRNFMRDQWGIDLIIFNPMRIKITNFHKFTLFKIAYGIS